MVTITENAGNLLTDMLQQHSKHERDVFRITRETAGLVLSIDQVHDGDETAAFEGTLLLTFAPELATELHGSTIDAMETESGWRLNFVPAEPASNGLEPASL